MRDFDLILSVHCKRIFPARLVEAVRSVNLHPGYNPYNRGWYPQVFAILKDEPIGATLHEMVADIDAGPIIAQSRVELRPEDTSLSLYRRVIEAEKGLLENWLRDVVAGTYEARPPAQEGDYNSIADYRQLCALDPDHVGTLRQHIDLLRALSHPPFANAHFRDADGRRIHVRVELSVEDDPD